MFCPESTLEGCALKNSYQIHLPCQSHQRLTCPPQSLFTSTDASAGLAPVAIGAACGACVSPAGTSRHTHTHTRDGHSSTVWVSPLKDTAPHIVSQKGCPSIPRRSEEEQWRQKHFPQVLHRVFNMYLCLGSNHILRRWLDPPNPPQPPSEEVVEALGYRSSI